MRIEALRQRVAKRWPFDAAHYPRIEEFHGAERRKFIADHIARHLSEECGKLARFLEQLDHSRDLGFSFDARHVNADLVPIIRDLMVCTLRLADAAGVPQERINDALETYLGKTVTLVMPEG